MGLWSRSAEQVGLEGRADFELDVEVVVDCYFLIRLKSGLGPFSFFSFRLLRLLDDVAERDVALIVGLTVLDGGTW